MKLNDYTVPTKSLKVRCSMAFEDDPLGGQTSGTDSAHKGFKPKRLFVSLMIPMDDGHSLTDLAAVAQAVDSKGARLVYDIADHTANTMKIRQVQFTDTFIAGEMDDVHGWRIDFTLVEYFSVPEKVEQRTETSEPSAQAAYGVTVNSGDEDSTTADADTNNAQTFWGKALQTFDNYLAPKDENTG